MVVAHGGAEGGQSYLQQPAPARTCGCGCSRAAWASVTRAGTEARGTRVESGPCTFGRSKDCSEEHCGATVSMDSARRPWKLTTSILQVQDCHPAVVEVVVHAGARAAWHARMAASSAQFHREGVGIG